MLSLGALAILTCGLASDLSVGFVNDYVPTSSGGVPRRAVYRRGADVCVAVGLAASDEPNRGISVSAGRAATFTTSNREYTIRLRSSEMQSLSPPKGRQGQIKVVYAGLPDAICSGKLSLPLKVRRGEEVVWEKIETQLFLVEARPFIPDVVDDLDVLAEAASYADGKAGVDAIATAVTDGVFRSRRFSYDDKNSVNAFDFGTGKARLGRLKPGGGPVPANCYQISTYLGVLLGALGVESELREIVLDPEATGEYAFKTAPVAPVGSATDRAESYSCVSMFSHQFLLVGGKVYDCAYAPQRGPAGEAWGRAVAGWTIAEYLGDKPGIGGGFVAGTPGGKRANLRVEPGEVPSLSAASK